MPFAPKIRKDILSALDEHILPALQQQEVPLGNVSPPFQFPAAISARQISKTVPHSGASNVGYPIQTIWDNPKLLSTFYHYLGFLYQGAADEHTIITAKQATKNCIPKGVYAIRWQSPSVLLFPSGTPRNRGKGSFWDSSEPPPNKRSILWLGKITSEIHVHTRHEITGKPRVNSHSLQIKDQTLIDLFDLFCREMQTTPVNHPHTAQAICLAMMSRLRQYLLVHLPPIANTSYPPTMQLKDVPLIDRKRSVWQEAVSFIQTHLHGNLTLPHIASHLELSPAHLSRIFHQFSNMPVMRYVRLQRIAAAQRVLEEGSENITEIAQLSGFGSVTVFCRAFHKETGLTPKQFRHHARERRKQ